MSPFGLPPNCLRVAVQSSICWQTTTIRSAAEPGRLNENRPLLSVSTAAVASVGRMERL